MSFKRTFFVKWLPPLLPMIAWIIGMEFLVKRGIIQPFIVPAPSAVMRTFFTDREMLFSAFLSTFSAAMIGLGLSIIVGFSLSILLSLSSILRRALYPYATFFQTVPIVSIAPVLVIWFGFGQPTVIASSFICSLFPIMASTLLGLQSTDPALIDLFRIYETSKLRTLWSCRIPFALPQIFSGIRIASGLSIIGAIVGEFIGGGGLGSTIEAARAQQRLDQIFATVLISALLGLFMIFAVNTASRLALGRWHVSERENIE
jgi:NitT/TauT family transport system permease protein